MNLELYAAALRAHHSVGEDKKKAEARYYRLKWRKLWSEASDKYKRRGYRINADMAERITREIREKHDCGPA